MKLAFRLAAVAAAAAALAAPAQADTSASATLENFQIQLFDLNPLDGIAPSISFNNLSGYGSLASGYAYSTVTGNYQGNSLYGATDWSPVSLTLATNESQMSASVAGTGQPQGTTLSASGSAQNTSGAEYWQYNQYGASAYAPYGGNGYTSFTLSANTVVVFSGTASVSATTTGGAEPNPYYYGEYANAYASLNVWGPSAGGGNGSQNSYDTRQANVGSSLVYGLNPYYVGASQSFSGVSLAVSFVNLTGSGMNGYLQAYAQADGYTYANAVPEPESYALMLAGLVAVGQLVRRRRA